MSLEELQNNYQLRPARLEDAQQVADLFNVCSQKIIGKNEFDAGELTAGWETGSIDMESDTLMVFHNEQLIAYGDIWGFVPPFVRVNIWVRVHPEYMNQGIGWLLNECLEERARHVTQKAANDLKVFSISYINIKEKAAFQLLSDRNATPVRHSWVMEGELSGFIPTIELAENIKIRTIKPEEYKQFYYLKEETFTDHWGHIDTDSEEGMKQFEAEHLQDPYYDPDLWFAAEVDHEMIGMIFGNHSTPFGLDYGWVSVLGVKRKWRNQGIGKALLLHFFRRIKDKGSLKVGLSVDSESLTGATKLYESVGLHVIEQYVLMEKVLREGIDLRVKAAAEINLHDE